MANSNVRSSAYRSAGGRQWNKTKSKSYISWDGPKTEREIRELQSVKDADDRNAVDKAAIRAKLNKGGYSESRVKVIPAGQSGIKRNRKKG